MIKDLLFSKIRVPFFPSLEPTNAIKANKNKQLENGKKGNQQILKS